MANLKNIFSTQNFGQRSAKVLETFTKSRDELNQINLELGEESVNLEKQRIELQKKIEENQAIGLHNQNVINNINSLLNIK